MKITILQLQLNSLIKMSRGMIRSKEIDPILTNFLFQAEGRELSIMTTNVELSLLAKTSIVEIEESGKILIPSQALIDIIRTIAPEDKIDFRSENDCLSIKVENSEWKIMLMKGEDRYPSLVDYESREVVSVNKEEFNTALKKVLTAAPVDDKRPEAQLLRLDDGRLEATDGVRYQCCEVSYEGRMLLMTSGAAASLSFVLDESVINTVGIGAGDNDTVFMIGGDLFIGQNPVSEFMECEAFLMLVEDNDKMLSVNKKEFIKSLGRVKILSDYDTRIVKIVLTKDSLTFNCSDRQGNSAVVSIPASWNADKWEVGFNIDYLESIINTFDGVDVDVRFGENVGKSLRPICISEGNHLAVLSQALV